MDPDFYKLDYLSVPKRRRRASSKASLRSPTSPIVSPKSPKSSRPRKKLNLALVQDPLLATAAANVHVAPATPITPPADRSHDLPLQIPGKEAPVGELAEELRKVEMFDTMPI